MHEPVFYEVLVAECGAKQSIEFSVFSALPFTENKLVSTLLQHPETMKVA